MHTNGKARLSFYVKKRKSLSASASCSARADELNEAQHGECRADDYERRGTAREGEHEAPTGARQHRQDAETEVPYAGFHDRKTLADRQT